MGTMGKVIGAWSQLLTLM